MTENFKDKLFSRLDRYARIETSSDENSTTFPSTKGQLELSALLEQEMRKIGLANVRMDKNGYVMGELPATSTKKVPAIGFLGHVDTSPDSSGKNVVPQIHRSYQGGDIVISHDAKLVLSPVNCPELKDFVGQDIVTASGGTLLGADNKAGVAIIMTAFEWLAQHPAFMHGPLKVAFTPDEEVGRGVDYFDVKAFGADFAYTVDGDITGTVENENFNADSVTVTINGKSFHPGSAKNRMANAVRIASDIISSWPENMLPETTQDREGFIAFLSQNATVEKAVVKGIVREHDPAKLESMEKLLEAIVAAKRLKYPGAEIILEFKNQYRNMREVLDKYPKVTAHLISAMRQCGVTPIQKPIRGGTDGARLSFMGLPTPNMFVGGGNFHGHQEWVSLDGMQKGVEVALALAAQWEKQP